MLVPRREKGREREHWNLLVVYEALGSRSKTRRRT